MPTFYNFRENGLDYSFDDIFVPADLFREGNLWDWGTNYRGQLGTSDLSSRSTPVTTFAGGTDWRDIGAGTRLSAAIKTDGTLWTWGYRNTMGVGTGSGIISTPVTTFAGGTNWKQVTCGRRSAAAIKTDGTLWTWGYGYGGQLGTNDVTNRPTPVTTFAGGTNWKQVSRYDENTAAIKTDGTLWAWGSGGYGALGNNSSSDVLTPVTTFSGGTNWKQVSCGDEHTAAIKTDGTLWIWGSGTSGRLGINNSTTKFTPVTTFAGGTNWKQVSCGDIHTAAIKTDGTLWIWGSGTSGRLGNGVTTGSISTPVTTFAGGTNWKQVGSGLSHMAAIKTDGTLWTWGSTGDGRLGNGATTGSISTPVTTFAGGTNWKQVVIYGQTVATTYIDPVI